MSDTTKRAVPVGWQLVPEQADQAMLVAGRNTMRVSTHADRGVAHDVWQQMLLFAPNPPAAPAVEPEVVVDVRTAERWSAKAFWRRRSGRTFVLVLAFCPTFFGAGVEVFGGGEKARGAALIVGPFWLGVATHRRAVR